MFSVVSNMDHVWKMERSKRDKETNMFDACLLEQVIMLIPGQRMNKIEGLVRWTDGRATPDSTVGYRFNNQSMVSTNPVSQAMIQLLGVPWEDP